MLPEPDCPLVIGFYMGEAVESTSRQVFHHVLEEKWLI